MIQTKLKQTMKEPLKALLFAVLLLFAPVSTPAQTGDASTTVSASVNPAFPPERGQFPATPVEDFIALVGVIGAFGMPAVVVGLILYFKFRRDRLTHDTVRAMIEKGVPLTPELLAQIGRKDPGRFGLSNRSRHLLPGLICVGVGAALLINGFNNVRSGIPGLPPVAGAIVLFIGVAFLIVWLVERNNKNDAQPPRQ